MFVSFDVSRAIELGGLQREAAEFIHVIALLGCEAKWPALGFSY